MEHVQGQGGRRLQPVGLVHHLLAPRREDRRSDLPVEDPVQEFQQTCRVDRRQLGPVSGVLGVRGSSLSQRL